MGWLVDWGCVTSCHLPLLLFAVGLFLFTLCLRAAASLLEAGLASLSWGYTSASLRLLQSKAFLLLLKIILVFPRDVGWTHMSSDNVASTSSADTYLGFVNINQDWTGLGRGLGLKFPSYWLILILLQNIIQNREASRGGIIAPSKSSPQLGCYEALLEQGHPLGGSHTSIMCML